MTETITTTASTDSVTSGYVNVDWSTYQPNNCYPYNPWGVYPYQPYPYQPWVGIPYYAPVTQQIFIPRGLTEDEIDAIADRVAEKILKAKKR